MCGILFRLSCDPPSIDSPIVTRTLSRGPSGHSAFTTQIEYGDKRHISLLHSVLNIRNSQVPQPVIVNEDVVFAFNGELYISDLDDTEILLSHFRSFADPLDAFRALEKFPGPWALVLVDLPRRRVLFGRDALGRRSLVIGNSKDEISISSVSGGDETTEVPPGIHSLSLESGNILFVYKFPTFFEHVEFFSPDFALPEAEAIEKLKKGLENSVCMQLQCMSEISVGVLFSGGIDSTVIAWLVGESEMCRNVDLINVSFVRDSPDRRTALASYADLEKKFPGRFRLLMAEITDHELEQATAEIVALIHPKDTHMDFNIGAALYFAGRGIGNVLSPEFMADPEWPIIREETMESETIANAQSIKKKHEVSNVICTNCQTRLSKAGCIEVLCRFCCLKNQKIVCHVHKSRLPPVVPAGDGVLAVPGDATVATVVDFDRFISRYISDHQVVSQAKVLLVGHGADELLGGYGRYRTREIFGSVEAKREEMICDLKRFWTRNLGRDDRCLSAHGRETRHPFWDECVLEIAGQLPSTEENKGVLRGVVRKFFGEEVACANFRKRAIQFGTRIAQTSNVRCFGSHRQGSGNKRFTIEEN